MPVIKIYEKLLYHKNFHSIAFLISSNYFLIKNYLQVILLK